MSRKFIVELNQMTNNLKKDPLNTYRERSLLLLQLMERFNVVSHTSNGAWEFNLKSLTCSVYEDNLVYGAVTTKNMIDNL